MKTSPAIRIEAVLTKAVNVNDGDNVKDVFSKLLGFNNLDEHTKQDCVSQALTDMRDEIREVNRQLKALGVPKHLRRLPIDAAINFTSPLTLTAPWNAHRGNFLRPDSMISWGWAAFVTESEDDDVSPESLAELEQELKELEEAAAASDVPASLRQMILRQARKIRTALGKYGVGGVQPLKDALSAGIGETLRDAPTVLKDLDPSAPATKQALNLLRKTWNTVAKVTKDGKAMIEFYRIVGAAAPHLSHWVEEGKKLLGH